MPLFTLLAEYRGGTYIRQITAVSPVGAVLNWCRKAGESIPRSLAFGLKQLATDEIRLFRSKVVRTFGA